MTFKWLSLTLSDPKFGLRVLEFSRPYAEGNYKMLHMAMLIHRKEPPLEKRIPGDSLSAIIQESQSNIIKALFEKEIPDVAQIIESEGLSSELQTNLNRVVSHREKLKGAAAGA